jgi:hypothetical protein
LARRSAEHIDPLLRLLPLRHPLLTQ